MRARIVPAAPSALLALLAIAALNAVFLIASLLAASANPAPRAETIGEAFAAGELSDGDYLKADWWRGNNQYNDCVVLQLAINRSASVTQTALEPAFYVSDAANPDACRSLRRLVTGEVAPAQLLGDRYGRYWHGYLPIMSALLGVTSVGTARQALRLLVIAALLALVAAGARADRPSRVAAVSVGATGLLFWGLPFYGQGLSYAPGDAVVMLGIAALVAWRRVMRGAQLIVFSAAYGSLVAYLDFLTGPLPTGACLLFLFAFIARHERPDSAWREAFAALGAYAVGAVLTVAIKQLLVAVLIGADELQSFAENVQLYSGLADIRGLPLTYVNAFVTLFKYTPLLTYYSIPAGIALLLGSALAWAGAAVRAFRSEDRASRSLFLAHLVAAGGIACWVILLPAHTAMHGFMTRILIVPFALGWSALALQLLRPPTSPSRSPLPR